MNNKLKVFITLLTLFSISACTSSNSFIKPINGQTLQGNEKISFKGTSFYLVNGGDGKMQTYTSLGASDEPAEGSGEAALIIANEALSGFTDRMIVENQELTEAQALENAVINKSDYLIYSRVEKWTDPIGINCQKYYADEASVLLSLYSVSNKKLINTSRLADKSCPAKLNGVPLSTGSPEGQYRDLILQWIQTNFNK